MDLSRRAQGEELMDDPALPEAELREALVFLARSNRWLGGVKTVLEIFERWSGSWPRAARASVLDIGSGAGDIPVALASWGRARGFDLRITALDAAADAAASKDPAVERVRADLFDFARSERRFDYVISSMTLHHIPEERQAEALLACDRLARRGVAVVDLERSLPAYWGVKLLTGLFGGRVTRYDGPLSVRKGFRTEELAALARVARMDYLKVRRRPFFRLSLSGEKPSA